jgi:hypothetical protein
MHLALVDVLLFAAAADYFFCRPLRRFWLLP